MKNIFVIIGSASSDSANERLVNFLENLVKEDLSLNVFNDLKALPHFDPALSISNTPRPVVDFRNAIEKADGIIICTPEYVFSIPAGLKNSIEWCVSTTVFSDKPLGIITASADGRKGHEELQLIMKTVMTRFTTETTLLIRGARGKIDETGSITDEATRADLVKFITAFKDLVHSS